MVVSGNVCRAVGGGTGFYRAFTHGPVYERRAWETLAHVRLVVRASIARLRAWLSSFVSRLRSAQRSARAETAGKHDLSARPGRARRPVSGAFPAQPQLRAHLTATGTAVERPPAHSDVRTLTPSAPHNTEPWKSSSQRASRHAVLELARPQRSTPFVRRHCRRCSGRSLNL